MASGKQEPQFRGEPDLATLRELVRLIDRTPAVTWTGQGGVKGRILAVIAQHDTETDPEGSEQQRDERA